MADDPTKDENNEEEDFGALTGGESDGGGDSDNDSFGMGSLPPLSDFDSSEGESDSDLPPLDTPSGDDAPISGLPPIVDIKVDTPAVRPSDLDTPTNKDSAPDTPAPQTPGDMLNTPSPAGFATPSPDLDSPDGGLGFQDFAADSDFSPETPEIGPGPDSDIETPMFDSAFGGDSDDFSTGGQSTPAPTQAMETPLFGSQPEVGGGGGGMGFDDDAFGAATPDMGGDAGTPVPDFSPDTGAGIASDTDLQLGAMAAPPKKRGVVGILVNLALVLVGMVIGIFISPMIGGMVPFVPDPSAEIIEQKDQEIAQLNGQIRRLTTAGPDDSQLTPEQVEELLARYETAQTNLNEAQRQIDQREQDLAQLDNSLLLVSADIEEKNNAFVEAQEALEDMMNETAITRARHDGLLAENERLSEAVGELEVANARRQATKDTLLHNIDLLAVQIQGGSPLAPERFDHASRVVRVTSLRDKVARAKWVDPQLMDEYTNLYLAELGISTSREYFFARLPVHDKLGNVRYRWAECLMNGNWSVYFRTIDDTVVGSYENAAGSGPPRYEFREELPGNMRADILDAIKAARVDDYKEKIAVLEQKQKIYDTQTKVQTSFSSL